PGADAIVTRRVTYRSATVGCPLHAFLVDQVRQRDITVRFGCRVGRLLVDHGAVVGVEVDTGDETTQVRSASVVLASGGYEANASLQRQALGSCPVHFLGTRRNRGSGVHLAGAAGADMWHMNVWPGRL